MKTEDWIDLLARNAGPPPRWAGARRLTFALLLGAVAATLLALLALGPIPNAMYATSAPWLKFGYAALLLAAGLWAGMRLAKPEARTRGPMYALVAAVTLAAAVSVASYLGGAPETRWAAFLGHSWRTCPWNILALSLPALVLLLRVARLLAPTRLRLAGFSAGVAAGAAGAFGYAFACLETSPAFIGAWYSLGIAMTGLLGALLGPRALRW